MTSERTAHSKENTTIAITDTIAITEDVVVKCHEGTEELSD